MMFGTKEWALREVEEIYRTFGIDEAQERLVFSGAISYLTADELLQSAERGAARRQR